MVTKVVIIVEPDGTTRHLVDSASERIGSAIGPKMETARASHVETWNNLSGSAKARIQITWPSQADPNLFWADMSPVDGPVLGPFEDYETAIAAEVQWLQDHNLPAPVPCHT